MSHKHTIEFIREEFTKRGCKLIDTEYKNAHTKLRYIASCGHEGYMNWCNFSHGSGTVCPKCADTKKTYEYVRDAFEKRGCKLLSKTYKQAFEDLDYIAKCGHAHRIKWANFQQGAGTYCPKCINLTVAKRNQIPIKQIRALFESKGCKLISDERNRSRDKLKYIASCGHYHEITYQNFKAGYGVMCPKCAKHDISENLIGDAMRELFPDVIEQYRIIDGKGGTLRLDFYSPSRKFGVEYNGRQHYGPISFFGGNKRWDEQQKRDNRKREYCKRNGILLVEIDGRLFDCRKSTKESIKELLRFPRISYGVIVRAPDVLHAE